MLTGRSRYLADLAVDGASHVAVVRSPVAHGTLRAVTWTEEPPAGVELIPIDAFDRFPGLVPIVWHRGDQTQASSQLVDRHLRYPGQPVALVVGPSESAVADAVELVAVDVDELPVAVTIEEAVADDAPILHPDRGSNVLARFTVGDDAEVVDAELAAADHTLSATFRIGRLAGSPMEGRGVVAVPDGDRLVVHTSTQAPHAVRDALASVLGWGLDLIRVVAPEVGGGFGVKDHAHDDELLVMVAAALLGRPLRWHESRAESLTVTTQARDEVHEVTVGFDDDGTLRALRIEGTRNTGAHLAIFGGGPLFACLGMAPGPYRWRVYRGSGTVVATNQVPTGAYRGFGQTQACLLRERIVDLVANFLGCDPVELRRRNLVRPDRHPWPLATGITYDNGDYRQPLDRAEELAGRWPSAAGRPSRPPTGWRPGSGTWRPIGWRPTPTTSNSSTAWPEYGAAARTWRWPTWRPWRGGDSAFPRAPARPGGPGRLRPGERHVQFRDPRVSGRRRPGHRWSRGRAVRRRPRLRHHRQPDDRRGPDPRGRGPGGRGGKAWARGRPTERSPPSSMRWRPPCRR